MQGEMEWWGEKDQFPRHEVTDWHEVGTSNLRSSAGTAIDFFPPGGARLGPLYLPGKPDTCFSFSVVPPDYKQHL